MDDITSIVTVGRLHRSLKHLGLVVGLIIQLLSPHIQSSLMDCHRDLRLVPIDGLTRVMCQLIGNLNILLAVPLRPLLHIISDLGRRYVYILGRVTGKQSLDSRGEPCNRGVSRSLTLPLLLGELTLECTSITHILFSLS